MKRVNVDKCASWWMDPVGPCMFCNTTATNLLRAKTFRSRREAFLCDDCKKKWVAGELSI